MYFKQFLHDDLGCSSYLIASRDSREAAVIDPQPDVQQYLDLVAERRYKIVAIIDTHLHADHVSGNRELAAATGAQLYLHEEADTLFPFHALRNGDALHLGPIILQVVHTPGHRPEALSLLVVNPPRSPEPSMVLSGDTLFVGDVGRPDLGGPDGAIQQYHSVQKLLQLEDYVEVFPAHFEGACGKGMCGRPSSTIGFERRFNPLLQLSEPEFIKLTSQAQAQPLNMEAIIATNRGEADFVWAMPTYSGPVPEVTIDEAESLLGGKDVFLLDVREPWEYEEKRIPAAYHLPQSQLATRLSEVPLDRHVLVTCRSGGRSEKATQFLLQMGYGRVSSVLGGTQAWAESGRPVETG